MTPWSQSRQGSETLWLIISHIWVVFSFCQLCVLGNGCHKLHSRIMESLCSSLLQRSWQHIKYYLFIIQYSLFLNVKSTSMIFCLNHEDMININIYKFKCTLIITYVLTWEWRSQAWVMWVRLTNKTRIHLLNFMTSLMWEDSPYQKPMKKNDVNRN